MACSSVVLADSGATRPPEELTAPARLELLGPVRAMRGGRELTVGPRTQQAVLAALATRFGQVVTAAELVASVWGESAPASAVSRVYNYVSTLRRGLVEAGFAEDALISAQGGYLLRLDRDLVDIQVFEARCRRAGALAQSGSHDSAAETLASALSLWRGQPLAGVPGPHAERERERLRLSRLTAVEALGRIQLVLGRQVELATDLAGLVREHPLRESLRELQMIALERSGRRAEALTAFAEARSTFQRELGVEPGPVLRRLQARILAGEETSRSELARIPW